MKAIIFDLDDTLYNEKDFVYGSFKEVALYLENKYKINYEKIYNRMLDILKTQGRGKIFNRICNEYHFCEDIPKLVEVYRRAKPNLKLYNDAKRFLTQNIGKYKLGLITDGLYYVQWNKIKLLNIQQYFDEIIVTDDHGKDFWKPSKEPYIKMSRDLNIPFHEMVYIGDNPNKDFYAAKRLGMLTIRIIREEGDHMKVFLEEEYEADYRIESLNEVEKILL
jgi:putative hydrolase of the HAD superfamily